MKYYLVLYFIAELNGGYVATSIGPYDDAASCQVAAQVAAKDGWRPKCYPVGTIPTKKKEEPALPPTLTPKEEPKEELPK